MSDWVEEIATFKRMAIAGATAEAISLALKRQKYAVEAMAELLELPLGEPIPLVWCDYCGSEVTKLDRNTGWCVPCTTKLRLEEQRIRDDEERARLEREVKREEDVVKQQRKRMREEYGVNPRKGR